MTNQQMPQLIGVRHVGLGAGSGRASQVLPGGARPRGGPGDRTNTAAIGPTAFFTSHPTKGAAHDYRRGVC
jgi:hypothetical protein